MARTRAEFGAFEVGGVSDGDAAGDGALSTATSLGDFQKVRHGWSRACRMAACHRAFVETAGLVRAACAGRSGLGRFLREQLANGPKRGELIEAAADPRAFPSAR